MSDRAIRVGCLSFPDGTMPGSEFALRAAARIAALDLDILVTSELPFGYWLASADTFDARSASNNCDLHEAGIAWLQALGVPLVATSRAARGRTRLSNDAILLRNRRVEFSHAKQFLPQQENWFEASWFEPGTELPDVSQWDDVRIGMLLCTEAMFPEQARNLGLAGADLIAVPRATGPSPIWHRALAMDAISGGTYVISANRSGGCFSGGALGSDPEGEPLTSVQEAGITIFEIDTATARQAKARYPRDVFSRVDGCSASPGSRCSAGGAR